MTHKRDKWKHWWLQTFVCESVYLLEVLTGSTPNKELHGTAMSLRYPISWMTVLQQLRCCSRVQEVLRAFQA